MLVSALTIRAAGSATTAPTLSVMLRWHADLDRSDPVVDDYGFLTDLATHAPFGQLPGLR